MSSIKMDKAIKERCPCGTGKRYGECCLPIHEGALAETPEALMRSRYSAFYFNLDPYLLESWHSSTRPESLEVEDAPKIKWLLLKIRQTGKDLKDREAPDFVEFEARYSVNGKAGKFIERSRFLKEAGHWRYLDGEFLEA